MVDESAVSSTMLACDVFYVKWPLRAMKGVCFTSQRIERSSDNIQTDNSERARRYLSATRKINTGAPDAFV